MNNVKRLAVYCGSAPGTDPLFADATRATAAAMVNQGVDLVYGGGRLGLMGLIADSVLELGGHVYGVIPDALVDLEVAHTGVSELFHVPNMHERKAKMTDLADAFLALPAMWNQQYVVDYKGFIHVLFIDSRSRPERHRLAGIGRRRSAV